MGTTTATIATLSLVGGSSNMPHGSIRPTCSTGSPSRSEPDDQISAKAEPAGLKTGLAVRHQASAAACGRGRPPDRGPADSNGSHHRLPSAHADHRLTSVRRLRTGLMSLLKAEGQRFDPAPAHLFEQPKRPVPAVKDGA
jgi:hypothetical protein